MATCRGAGCAPCSVPPCGQLLASSFHVLSYVFRIVLVVGIRPRVLPKGHCTKQGFRFQGFHSEADCLAVSLQKSNPRGSTNLASGYFSAVASGAAWLSGAPRSVVKALRKRLGQEQS